MRVLVTRPEPDAAATKAALERHGHSAVLSPMLEIRFEPVCDLGYGLVQALIVTSRNGVRALARSPVLPGLVERPLFAVGKGTAKDAHRLGFHGVMEGPGTAADLVDVIVANANPAGGRLIHFAGYKLAFDLEGALAKRGFAIDAIKCYEATPADRLTPEAEIEIRSGHLGAVLLMSPETSRTYVRLLTAAGLQEEAKNVACACISPATAGALTPFSPARIGIAERPNSEEVLALINRMAEQFR